MYVPDQGIGADIKDGERTTELNICWNIFNGWRMTETCDCVYAAQAAN